MQNFRHFSDLLKRLKAFEAVTFWKWLKGVGQWLLSVPGIIFGALIALLLFVWWYVIPGVVGLGMMFGIAYVLTTFTAVWWLKILAVLGILAAFVAYWNILAAAMGTWGDEPTDDLADCLGRAVGRIWDSFATQALILFVVFLFMEFREVFFIIGTVVFAIVCCVFLAIVFSED